MTKSYPDKGVEGEEKQPEKRGLLLQSHGGGRKREALVN